MTAAIYFLFKPVHKHDICIYKEHTEKYTYDNSIKV